MWQVSIVLILYAEKEPLYNTSSQKVGRYDQTGLVSVLIYLQLFLFNGTHFRVLVFTTIKTDPMVSLEMYSRTLQHF